MALCVVVETGVALILEEAEEIFVAHQGVADLEVDVEVEIDLGAEEVVVLEDLLDVGAHLEVLKIEEEVQVDLIQETEDLTVVTVVVQEEEDLMREEVMEMDLEEIMKITELLLHLEVHHLEGLIYTVEEILVLNQLVEGMMPHDMEVVVQMDMVQLEDMAQALVDIMVVLKEEIMEVVMAPAVLLQEVMETEVLMELVEQVVAMVLVDLTIMTMAAAMEVLQLEVEVDMMQATLLFHLREATQAAEAVAQVGPVAVQPEDVSRLNVLFSKG